MDRVALPALTRLPALPGRRLVAAMFAAGVLTAALVAGYPWLRDSSLVEVRETTVEGVSGYRAAEITAALERAASGMSTLDVDVGALRTAVDGFPTVRSISVDADFPHGLVVTVEEDRPVAALVSGSSKVAVAGDGRALPGVPIAGLPLVPARGSLGSGSAVPKQTLAVLEALRAAPAGVRREVSFGGLARETGITFQLRNGITLRMGGPERMRAKWLAAESVLGDPELGTPTYIDLRAPDRPAAGGVVTTGAGASLPGQTPSAGAPSAEQNPQLQPQP
jgi:cell division protein FtsQ